MSFFIRRKTWRLWVGLWVRPLWPPRWYWTHWRKGFAIGPVYAAVVFYGHRFGLD